MASEDPTPAELARNLTTYNRSLDRLNESVLELSRKLDRLPESMAATYVRKDVATEQNLRMERSIQAVAEQFERIGLWVRWIAASVMVPVILSILGLLYARGG